MDVQYVLVSARASNASPEWSPVSRSDTNPIPVMPRSVLLRGRLDARHALREPLVVTVERGESGWYLASDQLFLQWGEGQTPEEAISDFRSTLAEYYDLVAQGASTSESDSLELRRLQQYVGA